MSGLNRLLIVVYFGLNFTPIFLSNLRVCNKRIALSLRAKCAGKHKYHF